MPDDLASTLAEIRAHNERVIALCGMAPLRVQQLAEHDVPRLLAALEAVLKLTEPPDPENLEYDIDGPLGFEVSKAAIREAITTALTGKPASDEHDTRPASSFQNPAGVVRVIEEEAGDEH